MEGHSFEALEEFSTDFTELLYDGGAKKARLIVILDIGSRWAGRWSVAGSRNRTMALEAVDSLREGMVSLGYETLSGMIVHHDKDSVYTSHAWLERLLLGEGARLSYAQRGAKANPWNRVVLGPIRGLEWRADPGGGVSGGGEGDSRRATGYYNGKRRHSALDYRTPYEVLLEPIDGEDRRQLALVEFGAPTSSKNRLQIPSKKEEVDAST